VWVPGTWQSKSGAPGSKAANLATVHDVLKENRGRTTGLIVPHVVKRWVKQDRNQLGVLVVDIFDYACLQHASQGQDWQRRQNIPSASTFRKPILAPFGMKTLAARQVESRVMREFG